MKNILIMDDDKDILTVVELLLSMNGYNVKTTDNWCKIYEKINSFNPRLILLDISLGGEDGRNI